MVNSFLHLNCGLVGQLLVFEHERQFLQRAPARFREQEPDNHNLKSNPTAVGQKPSPMNVVQSDWIDKCREERGTAPEELEDGNTARTLRIWEQFHQIGYGMSAGVQIVGGRRHTVGQGIVAGVVRRRI
jgi:hypothetical protein